MVKTIRTRWLRKTGNSCQVRVLANKLEGIRNWDYERSPILQNLQDAEQQLGFGPVLPISALHAEGMAELAMIIQEFEKEAREKKQVKMYSECA